MKVNQRVKKNCLTGKNIFKHKYKALSENKNNDIDNDYEMELLKAVVFKLQPPVSEFNLTNSIL